MTAEITIKDIILFIGCGWTLGAIRAFPENTPIDILSHPYVLSLSVAVIGLLIILIAKTDFKINKVKQ
jgi:hypothetical protein